MSQSKEYLKFQEFLQKVSEGKLTVDDDRNVRVDGNWPKDHLPELKNLIKAIKSRVANIETYFKEHANGFWWEFEVKYKGYWLLDMKSYGYHPSISDHAQAEFNFRSFDYVAKSEDSLHKSAKLSPNNLRNSVISENDIIEKIKSSQKAIDRFVTI